MIFSEDDDGEFAAHNYEDGSGAAFAMSSTSSELFHRSHQPLVRYNNHEVT
jgi:hypothetical protein